MCDQVQHSLFRAVVGKLQYITEVRPDLMFETKCLSHTLASPTLADLTRAKKVLRYLKGTRELNLYLTIPALKPNDLNKTLKHVTGQVADFGQTDFGHPYPTDFGQTDFGQTDFGKTEFGQSQGFSCM